MRLVACGERVHAPAIRVGRARAPVCRGSLGSGCSQEVRVLRALGKLIGKGMPGVAGKGALCKIQLVELRESSRIDWFVVSLTEELVLPVTAPRAAHGFWGSGQRCAGPGADQRPDMCTRARMRETWACSVPSSAPAGAGREGKGAGLQGGRRASRRGALAPHPAPCSAPRASALGCRPVTLCSPFGRRAARWSSFTVLGAPGFRGDGLGLQGFVFAVKVVSFFPPGGMCLCRS